MKTILALVCAVALLVGAARALEYNHSLTVNRGADVLENVSRTLESVVKKVNELEREVRGTNIAYARPTGMVEKINELERTVREQEKLLRENERSRRETAAALQKLERRCNDLENKLRQRR